MEGPAVAVPRRVLRGFGADLRVGFRLLERDVERRRVFVAVIPRR
jgi:hypothetical protein